jgi:Outer membrane protein beta-barrel domain
VTALFLQAAHRQGMFQRFNMQRPLISTIYRPREIGNIRVPTEGTRQLRIAFVLTALLFISSPTRAQSVSFGVTGGVPLNNLATASEGMVSTTGRYTIGPALRVGLPRAFAVDVEFLYKRFNFGFASDPARIGVHRLELPLLLRYGFRGSSVHAFVHAGVSFNWAIPGDGANSCPNADPDSGFYCIGNKTSAQLRHEHTYGPVLGAGAEFKLKALRLAPEFRVTRWVDRNFGTQDSPLRSNLTQVELLLGLKF